MNQDAEKQRLQRARTGEAPVRPAYGRQPDIIMKDGKSYKNIVE
jgi:hypothetical protein